MPERQLRSAGHTQRIDHYERELPEYDARSGEHLWMVTTVYRVVPEQWFDAESTPILDQENLLAVVGPGCLHCERAFAPALKRRRCPGPPD